MPPRSPQHADALDVALAPTKGGAAGFFQALKPNDTTNFPSTSRINVDRPAAQRRVAARVVPPPPAPTLPVSTRDAKVLLAAHMPHASSLGGLAKRVEHAVVDHPLRTALMLSPTGPISLAANPLSKKVAEIAQHETTKGLAAVARAQAGPDLHGAASTNAGILNAAASGKPFASLSPAIQQKIKGAIGFFAINPSYHYDVPNLGAYTDAQKKKAGLPPTATDFDVVRKNVSRVVGHRNYFESALHNLPLDLINVAASPVAVAHLITHPSDIPEFAREQYAFGKSLIPGVGDPAETFKQHPFSTLTAFTALGRGAGGLAGTAARLAPKESALNRFATPTERNVTPAGFNVETPEGVVPHEPIYRGMTSPKLDERLAQAAADKLASTFHGHERIPGSGARLVRQHVDNITKSDLRQYQRDLRDNVEPAARAATNLSKTEELALREAHGQGALPTEVARHYAKQAAEHATEEQAAIDSGGEAGHETHVEWKIRQKDLEGEAKLWAKVVRNVGDEITPDMREALSAYAHANRYRETHLADQSRGGTDVPLVAPETALRRAYVPNAVFRRSVHGDANASSMLEHAHELNRLHDELPKVVKANRAEKLQKLINVEQSMLAGKHARDLAALDKHIAGLERVAGKTSEHGARTPATDAIESLLNRQGHVMLPEARRLGEIKGRADEAFPQGDRIKPSEIVTANKHLRLLERKLRAAQNPATRRRLQAKIDEFTPIRDKMVAAPVGPEVRQVRAQAARAGVELRTAARIEQAGAPALPRALRADEAHAARMQRPAENELAKAIARRERLAHRGTYAGDELGATQVPFENARTRALQQRLDQTPTEESVRTQIEQAYAAQDEALHNLRTAHRERVGAPVVERGAPLDVHDPLYVPHVYEQAKGLRGRFGGSSGGIGTTNANAAAHYGDHQLGEAGHQSTGALLDRYGIDHSPEHFFGAIAKPLNVAAKLSHLAAQLHNGIEHAPPGTVYNTATHVRVRLDSSGTPNSRVHTTHSTEQAARNADNESSLAQQILGGVVEEKKGIHSTVKDDGGQYALVTRAAYDNLQNSLKSFDTPMLKIIRKTTGFWRWATLVARPAWLVGNISGNTIQAAMAGAGPRDAYRALRPDKFPTPEGVEQGGLFKNTLNRPQHLGSRLRHPVDAFTRIVIDANSGFENFARRAVAHHHLTQEAKAAAHGQFRTLRTSFKRSNQAVREFERNPTEHMAHRVVHEVNYALGDFLRARKTPYLDVVSPFHRWYTFIGKLMLTMPVKTPGRALALQRLGALGLNIQQQELGGDVPNSIVGALQWPQHLPVVGGHLKSTQALLPYSTLFQLFSPSDQSSTDPGMPQPGGLAGAINPLALAFANTASGRDLGFTGEQLKDKYGQPTGGFNPRVLVHQFEDMFPIAGTVAGYNRPDDALDPLERNKTRPTQQTPANALERGFGYLIGSSRPFDVQKNNVVARRRFKRNELALVHAWAKHEVATKHKAGG